MNQTKHQHKQSPSERIWSALFSAFDTFILVVFLLVSTFPGQALAFSVTIDPYHLPSVITDERYSETGKVLGITSLGSESNASSILTPESTSVRQSISPGTIVRVLSTAYTSSINETDGDPSITASGAKAGPGTIAANWLPFDTRVRIGNKLYTVKDRMNARYDNTYMIDIWMNSREQAIAHGSKVLVLKIVSIPK